MLDYPVTLEVTENGVQQTVEGFCCGDRDRKRLRVSLLLQGRKIELSPYCTAAFTAVKPDETEISHPCSIEDGDICYVPAAQTLAVPGTLTCRIVVYGSDESILYAPQFALVIEQEEIPSETVVSEDEHSLLPIHVLSALSDANGTLLYRDLFAGKTEIEDTFSDLPAGSTGQLAYVRQADADHPRGFYRFGTQWEPLSQDTHEHLNQTLLDSLHVENDFLFCGSRPVCTLLIVQAPALLPSAVPDGQMAYVQSNGQLMYRMNGNWYVIMQTHFHTNKTVLDKLSFDPADGLLYDGEPILASADTSDTAPTPLELGTAYAALQIRSNWADVPVYVTDAIGYAIGMFTNTDPDEADYIRLVEAQDYETGLPTPMLRVKRGNAVCTLFPRTFHGLVQDYTAGNWYDEEGAVVSAPSLSGFNFAMLQVALDTYTSLDDLPPKAQSALETFSRMVNVSASAMGGLGDRADAVRRFSGTLEANRHYAFAASDDFTLTFPAAPWSAEPYTILLDLYCLENVTLTLPRERLLDGGTLPDTTAGYHTLEFTFVPEAGRFSVGHTDRVVPQYWDDIPDEVTSFGNCTWSQIKSIGQHGYVNNYGQWCIRRNNVEEVWFEIGDEKTIELSTGETLVLQIWDFNHDDLADGSGKAPFTIGMKGLTQNAYQMNTYITTDGGWEMCYFRLNALPAIRATLPDALRAVIGSVSKISTAGYTSATVTTTEDLFLPSVSEYGSGDLEGGQYAVFNSQSKAARANYWTRSAYPCNNGAGYFRYIKSTGENNTMQSDKASKVYSVRLAFCV